MYPSFLLLHISSDDDNRIVLKPLSGSTDCQSDYINASYVDVRNIYMLTIFIENSMIIIIISQLFVFQGYDKIHKFIACQGKHYI